MTNLRFVYVAKSDTWQERLRDDWSYIYKMSKFFQWWLRKKFQLYYRVDTDVLVVVKTPLMGLRFGMSELIKHHSEKGEENYHFYLSYFKPRFSDCGTGFYADTLGLVRWNNLEDRDAAEPLKTKFFALENCTKVSHMLLHEVGRQKQYGKEYKDLIHEQWDKHIYGAEDYEYFDKNFRKMSGDESPVFATMRVPERMQP